MAAFFCQTVDSYHVEGFHERTVVQVPEKNYKGETISHNARSLLCEVSLEECKQLLFFSVKIET